MRRRAFDADLHERRVEIPSDHRVVRRPPFGWQLYKAIAIRWMAPTVAAASSCPGVRSSIVLALCSGTRAPTRNSEAGCSLCRLQIAVESLPVPRTPDEKNGSPAPTSGARAPKKPGVFSKLFAEVAKVGSREVGRAWVFALALGTVVVWAISGPFFGFSDTWQLVINTGTTIVTFLMVFLIQNSQNRDSAAIQVKLDELIRVSKANNAFMGLEHLTDEELEDIEGKNEGRAKAVLEARKASADAKHKLRVIDRDG
jgi:low affinity Fe/Cu permease